MPKKCLMMEYHTSHNKLFWQKQRVNKFKVILARSGLMVIACRLVFIVHQKTGLWL